MERAFLENFFKTFPVLKTNRLTLEEIGLSDLGEYYQLMSDPKVVQFLSPDDIPHSETEARNEIVYWRNLFYSHRSIFWKISSNEINKLIGTIGFNSWNMVNRRAEISYELSSQFWRKGIMTEVLREVIKFAQEEMNVYRMEARTLPDNIASRKLLEKVGFKQECIQKGYRIIAGEPKDVVLYSIIKI